MNDIPLFSWTEADAMDILATCERDGLVPLIERHFPPGCTVLESGCGLARYVRYLKDRGWMATGLELVPKTVAQIRRIWPDLDVRQGDSRRSPFDNGSFDAAMSLGVVEHFAEGPEAGLRDLHRILRPGGVAIITVPCMNRIRSMKRRVWWPELRELPREMYLRLVRHDPRRVNRRTPGFRFAVWPAYGEFFEYWMTPAEFAAQVSRVGFEILEQRPHAVIDGIWHDLNPFGLLIKYERYCFHPTWVAHLLNWALSRRHFTHCHMQAIVARKPETALPARVTPTA